MSAERPTGKPVDTSSTGGVSKKKESFSAFLRGLPGRMSDARTSHATLDGDKKQEKKNLPTITDVNRGAIPRFEAKKTTVADEGLDDSPKSSTKGPETKRVIEGTVMSHETPAEADGFGAALDALRRRGKDTTLVRTDAGITVEYDSDNDKFVIATPGPNGIEYVEITNPDSLRPPSSDTDRDQPTVIIDALKDGTAREVLSPEDSAGLFPEALGGTKSESKKTKEKKATSGEVTVYESKSPEKPRTDAFVVNIDKVLAGSKGEKEQRMVAAIKECLEDGESIALKTQDSTVSVQGKLIDQLLESGIDPKHLHNLTAIAEGGGASLSFDREGRIHHEVDPRMKLPETVKDQVSALIQERYGELMTYDSSAQTIIKINMREGSDMSEFRRQQRVLKTELREILDEAGLQKRRIRPSRKFTTVRHLLSGKRLEKKKLINWILGNDDDARIDIQS